MKIRLALSLTALLALTSSGCLFGRHKNTNPLGGVQSVQPDKTLFDRAMKDIDAGKYMVARLDLQALINAYPDSEYLARAKMAIADSWYREGGSEGLAQAEAEYKDFITFFPTMKEASEAQLKIADIQFQQLEKADRDPTHAIRAERELRTFLMQYPDSPLAGRAKQMLRQVQEVLADRQFRIGRFYLIRENYRAAQDRLKEVVTHYPLYSQGADATEMLARSYLTTSSRYLQALPYQRVSKVRELYKKDAEADKQSARDYLTYLIERYPVSGNVKWARHELQQLHAPVPKPSPDAIAFNKEELASRQEPTRFQRWTGMFHTKPLAEIARADKVGQPPLSDQPNANVQGVILTPQAGGPTLASAGSGQNQIQIENVGTGGLTQTDTPAPDNSSAPSPATSAAATDNTASELTPDELDKQEQERILESEVERNVPYINTKQLKKSENNAKAPK